MHEALLPRARQIAHHIRNCNLDSGADVVAELIVKMLEFGFFTGITIGFGLALAIQIWFGG